MFRAKTKQRVGETAPWAGLPTAARLGNTQNQLPITNYEFPITDLHRYHKCLNGHDIILQFSNAHISILQRHIFY
ncbi:hypothetical protein JYQ62_24860 [Nostoc sp. UHCC 0702]|nr:hypothetical protein JYQ62_24860 [Nostoc sp. UHCC 0702]